MSNLCRVGVFMGGKSIEREVSFNSGRTICDHLDVSRYTPIPIFQTVDGSLYILPWHFLHRGKITDFVHRLEAEARKIRWDDLPSMIDFAYIAMHGRYAEDGTLQGFFEILNIPYLGAKVLGSALSMNKIIQKDILRAHQIAVARDIIIYPHELPTITIDSLLAHLKSISISLPCVVKPHHEGSSLGISIIDDPSLLLNAVYTAATIDPSRNQAVLIEEKIIGMEFTAIILYDYKTNQLFALPPTEIVYARGYSFLDYDQKYMPGMALKYTPARCTELIIHQIQKTSIAVMKALELRTIARIDGFVTAQEEIIITDPNALAGMAPSSFIFNQAAQHNMSHTDLINHLIDSELFMYKKNIQNSITHTKTKLEDKKRIAVLMGGASNEREVSLESGRNIMYKLSPEKYIPIAIFLDRNNNLYRIPQRLLVQNATAEIEEKLENHMRIGWQDLPTIADFVFIGLHGGIGENGSVQGTLEMLGMPYNGSSVLASALCMDKYKTAQFLQYHGFAVPTQQLIEKKYWQENRSAVLAEIQDTLQFPLIVKPHDDGCSVLVSKIKSIHEIAATLDEYFTTNKNYALIEEFIVGTELTVGVLGNHEPRALPPSQVITTRDVLSMEEKFLPGAGENQTPALLPSMVLELVQNTIAHAYKTIGCAGYARIDCFYQTAEQSPIQQERVVILEFNSLPALTPATCIFHQAAEVSLRPMEFIDAIIQFGFEQHQQNSELPSHVSSSISSENITE